MMEMKKSFARQAFYLMILSILIKIASLKDARASSIDLRMPDIKPDYSDQYLCMAHRLSCYSSKSEYIVGFEPRGNSSRVHHMLIFGCELPGIYQPGSPKFVWDCSGMRNSESKQRSFEFGPICNGPERILYGWALDAKSLKLPDRVGFKVGGDDSGIKFLVLQVHYHDRDNHGHHLHRFKPKGKDFNWFNNNDDISMMMLKNSIASREDDESEDKHRMTMMSIAPDNSGFLLNVKQINNDDEDSGIIRQAGVLVMTSNRGLVYPGKNKIEMFCEINDKIEIHPFRYRVHTHKLGTRVMGAKLLRSNPRFDKIFGSDTLEQIIGDRDPQEPQMFYPIEQKGIVLRQDDIIYGACEYDNYLDRTISMGPTGDDEMCNFYLMYWTNGPKLLSKNTCDGIDVRGEREGYERLYV